MQFLYPSLTLGFLAVLLPLLIQLINLMRQRRVRWAAMDFLLQAYRKHRRWIWLQQLILLLLRMVAVAAVVAMLAHLVTNAQWARFFGGQSTHHIVLLDDSYSMTDATGTQSTFGRALSVLSRLADRAMEQDSLQRFTLLRFSRAQAAAPLETAGTLPADSPDSPDPPDPSAVGDAADLQAVAVDVQFGQRLAEQQGNIRVSQLSAGPENALQLAAELAEQSEKERVIVYVLSDFRVAPWQAPASALALIQRLERAGADVRLVRCVEDHHPNLAIVHLAAAEGARAAGVPLFVDVTVQNYGPREVQQVAVAMRSLVMDPVRETTEPGAASSQTNDLPTLQFERLAPGESATRRAQVYFPAAGQHVVIAELPADAVPTDNRRWCAVDVPEFVEVLVVDGDLQQRNAAYLGSVFQPGDRVQTGIRPRVESEAFLRDASAEQLARFRAIYLLDVARLDPGAQQNLRDYAHAGGGVAVFLGPNCDLAFYRDWATSQQFFPVAPSRLQLLSPATDSTPDLLVEEHPIFRVLQGEGSLFAAAIRFQQFVEVVDLPEGDETIRQLAALRGGYPLVVERVVGRGRVLAFLSSLAPVWNNWATQPTFPVVMLEAYGYLDAQREPAASRRVGTALAVPLDARRHQEIVQFRLPGSDPAQVRLAATRALPQDAGGDAPRLVATLPPPRALPVPDTGAAGIYEAWLRTLDGSLEVRRFALNVDPLEGNLTLPSNQELASRLATTNAELVDADAVALGTVAERGFSWSQFLLGVLVVLLILEQGLAYLLSYHPAAVGGMG